MLICMYGSICIYILYFSALWAEIHVHVPTKEEAHELLLLIFGWFKHDKDKRHWPADSNINYYKYQYTLIEVQAGR